MRSLIKICIVPIFSLVFSICAAKTSNASASDSLLRIFENHLKTGILDIWYPRVIDADKGGYYSNYSYNWNKEKHQEKMLVSQSRHIWTSSQAALFYNDSVYAKYALHGFYFLRDFMWDKKYGGFFNIRSEEGTFTKDSYQNEKRAYGCAFAIYGLSSLYELTKDTQVLEYAKKTFLWLEKYSHDKMNGGYVDALAQDGSWLEWNTKDHPILKGKASKDFNSSIHLLEAFTSLYKVWPDPLVKSRLEEMFILVRDTFTDEKGFLQLNFTEDWQLISFKDSSQHFLLQNSYWDHVSFGHDVETAYLLLEASQALEIQNDTQTLRIAKRMVDHSLANGFDWATGGFFYEGYYFRDSSKISILNKEKSWWVQAEGLNALLMMYQIYPMENRYFEAFLVQWKQIDNFIIDKKYGEWFINGLDYCPEAEKEHKASVWKVNYHNGRALMNCIRMLKNNSELTERFHRLTIDSK